MLRGSAHQYFRPESIWVAIKDCLYSCLPESFVLLIVAAAHAVAVQTVSPTGEAFAVQLETPRVFAVTVLPGAKCYISSLLARLFSA